MEKKETETEGGNGKRKRKFLSYLKLTTITILYFLQWILRRTSVKVDSRVVFVKGCCGEAYPSIAITFKEQLGKV